MYMHTCSIEYPTCLWCGQHFWSTQWCWSAETKRRTDYEWIFKLPSKHTNYGALTPPDGQLFRFGLGLEPVPVPG